MRHFFKRFVSIILVLSLLLCFMMVPYTVHALGAEMTATLGLATGLGPVAPVIATILLGAGLGVVAANTLPTLIKSFYNSCDSATKADLNSMGTAYEAAVDAQTEAASVNLNLTSNVINAVNNYVSGSTIANNDLTIGSSAPDLNYFDYSDSSYINIRAGAYATATYTTPVPVQVGFNNLMEVVPGSNCYLSVYVYDGTYAGSAVWRYCPVVILPDGQIISVDRYADYDGTTRDKVYYSNISSFGNFTYSSAGNHNYDDIPSVSFNFYLNYLNAGGSNYTKGCSFELISDPTLPTGRHVNSTGSKFFCNLYPYVQSFTPSATVPSATVNQTYLPTGTLIDGAAADASKPLTDNTVIAVPVPQYGIEEGVKIPTKNAAQWTDEVILYTPEDFRDQSVDPAPPIDVSDNLTWPTAPGQVLDPADADALPNDIATDLTLDPDAGNPDGEEVSWWFRIPILGAILRALARLWELLSQFFNSIGTWFAQLFNNLWNWLKSIFDRLGNIWNLLNQILAKLGQLILDLPAFLADIFLLISGYTIFQELLDGFLPTVVVSVLWVFWMAALAIWIVRWLADR